MTHTPKLLPYGQKKSEKRYIELSPERDFEDLLFTTDMLTKSTISKNMPWNQFNRTNHFKCLSHSKRVGLSAEMIVPKK